ncbi:hypothetical protein DICPUDRAFT_98834 [Dictyostelium purpureum]|uniref:F-box domain-containing protein n=1 Tax=Dictyostelium purpureum TaxID=5786 RepID=F0ZTW8_DICPU|nr:uncharacterized protein DICPUDRAFT_98834 [Dictyostelium purpureum]EGC32605.1 hypothetical protein DICPUDRAFT_98834 [Dictyostelium purpureum]|eukprot:XP_003290857.1 hypothetical protein DICPUDRAFT_98834 [Dictyostelium purpureum]
MNQITNNNNNKNIFDLTFNINQLPTHLIRKILSYYFNHCLSIWMDLCLVCKFWMEMVMPYLPDTFYLMDSLQKLETYLNLVEYGGTFPRKFLKPTLLRVVKPPSNLKKHPFHINSLGIYINRYQMPHQDDSIIPEVIYQQIFRLSPDLKSFSFQTENHSMSDLYYILKTINDPSITLNLLTQLDFSNCWFSTKIFEQLLKLFSGSNEKLIGGTILDLVQYIFVESSINSFEILDTPITFGLKQNQLSKYSTSTFDKILTPMQTNLEHIAVTIRSNDQFLSLLTNSIKSSKSLREFNMSGSVLTQVSEISNLFSSLQHCETLLKINLFDLALNYENNGNQQPMFQNIGAENEQDWNNQDDEVDNVVNSNAFLQQNNTILPNQFDKFSFLYGTQSLTSINVSSIHPVKEEEMISLFENLRYSSQLRELYAKRTRLTPKCLTALTNLIREPNSSLELLHLGYNNFSGSISILLMAFQLSKTLTDIDISSNQLGNNEGLAISQFIKESSLVRHLNISNSDFKLSALNQLGTALSINKSLVSLDLSNIHLGMLEVTYIIDGLVQHPTISLLNLSNCGSKEMIKTLEETSQLRCNIISSFNNFV